MVLVLNPYQTPLAGLEQNAYPGLQVDYSLGCYGLQALEYRWSTVHLNIFP